MDGGAAARFCSRDGGYPAPGDQADPGVRVSRGAQRSDQHLVFEADGESVARVGQRDGFGAVAGVNEEAAVARMAGFGQRDAEAA
jgi:hypothetical protein